MLAKSLALLAAAPWRGLVLGLRTRSGLIGLYHAQVALGRLLSEFGVKNEQYRKPEANLGHVVFWKRAVIPGRRAAASPEPMNARLIPESAAVGAL